jgi:SAM-dependent methyltransferase
MKTQTNATPSPSEAPPVALPALSPDPEKLHQFALQMVGDLGAAATASLILVGEELGLFRALAAYGPLAPTMLAEATDTEERYVREWLSAMAASSYVEYEAESGFFSLTPEQAAVFANEDSPVYMIGGFHSVKSLFLDERKIADAFRSGHGVAWGDHSDCLFTGTAKFFRPSYQTHLIQEWIPALDGVEEKLKRGAVVADVGCGHGLSTIMMAQAYPDSTFVGIEPHEASVEAARANAASAEVTNIRFENRTAKTFEGSYDLVAFFDCLHDMGDPVGAVRHARSRLAEGGRVMLVEPMAGESLADNLNPIGRVYYAFSTMVCTPASRSQEVGLGLGAQAGEGRLGDVLREGGYEHVRRAAETPFNVILEAK